MIDVGHVLMPATDATSQTCKLAPLNLSADAMDFHYNSHHASFYKDSSTGQDIMQLTMEGTSGIRLAPKDSWQLYGQVEVTARVDGASGAVTAFYVSTMAAAPVERFHPCVFKHVMPHMQQTLQSMQHTEHSLQLFTQVQWQCVEGGHPQGFSSPLQAVAWYTATSNC